MYIYTYLYHHNIETLLGKRNKNIGAAVKTAYHRFVSLGLLASIYPHVHLFTYVSSAPTGQILLKFDIGNFH